MGESPERTMSGGSKMSEIKINLHFNWQNEEVKELFKKENNHAEENF